MSVLGRHTAVVFLNNGYAALIDADDAEMVGRYRWRSSAKHHRLVYAHTGCKVPMEKIVLGTSQRIDHKNGDGLDNRRQNLRPCTHAENCRNRGPVSKKYGVKGVYKQKRGAGYGAQIRVNYQIVHLGTYPTIEQAARAYDEAAILFFGEFARPNFPQGVSPC